MPGYVIYNTLLSSFFIFIFLHNIFSMNISIINFVHIEYRSWIRQPSKKISRRSEQKKAKPFIGEIECRSFYHFSTTNESKTHTLHKSLTQHTHSFAKREREIVD
jgi:hypothetical protein